MVCRFGILYQTQGTYAETRAVFPISKSQSIHAFNLIHCDIWGLYQVASSLGAHYFFTIIDDFSRAVWTYLMKEKK